METASCATVRSWASNEVPGVTAAVAGPYLGATTELHDCEAAECKF